MYFAFCTIDYDTHAGRFVQYNLLHFTFKTVIILIPGYVNHRHLENIPRDIHFFFSLPLLVPKYFFFYLNHVFPQTASIRYAARELISRNYFSFCLFVCFKFHRQIYPQRISDSFAQAATSIQNISVTLIDNIDGRVICRQRTN